jgi:hypothetical protein
MSMLDLKVRVGDACYTRRRWKSYTERKVSESLIEIMSSRTLVYSDRPITLLTRDPRYKDLRVTIRG